MPGPLLIYQDRIVKAIADTIETVNHLDWVAQWPDSLTEAERTTLSKAQIEARRLKQSLVIALAEVEKRDTPPN